MAIRISHARAEDIGALGIEAGKGEQQVRQQAQRFEKGLQAQAQDAQLTAARINADTAITKAVMDAKNSREVAEFDSFMRAESDRRQMAWETEKIELKQRHDFDLNMQRKDLENSMIMEADARKKEETRIWMDALDKAEASGDISSDEHTEARLRRELGQSGSLFSGGSLEEISSFSERAEARRKRKAAAGREEPEAVQSRIKQLSIKAIELSYELTPDQVKETQSQLDSSDVTEADITRMVQILDAAVEVKKSQPFQTGGFSYRPAILGTGPLSFLEKRKAAKSKKRAEIVEATKKFRP